MPSVQNATSVTSDNTSTLDALHLHQKVGVQMQNQLMMEVMGAPVFLGEKWTNEL